MLNLNQLLITGYVCFGYALSQQTNLAPPQVTLDVGTLRGFHQQSLGGRPIASFQSIPYVKQPMGRHRFKDSIEMGPWLGVYDATQEAPDCLQLQPSPVGDITGSEDCLYINVYTPHVPSGTIVRPLMDVVVYIHGGAFMYYGSKYFTPKYLLDKDIVFVTFNYRLGPLGFLSTGGTGVSGNTGMKDQVMALRWVKRYISSFGGDPNKVTLAGHSSGAAAVHYHLLSPLSKGLFHKAVISGGSALNPWASAENLLEKTLALAAKLGCAFIDTNLIVKCLRSRPAQHIVAFSKQLQGWKDIPIAPWAPAVESLNQTSMNNPPGTPLPFLAEDPLTIISSGRAYDVPVLFLYTAYEGAIPTAYFAFNDSLRSELLTRWDELLPHVLDFYYTADPANISQICQAIKLQYMDPIDITDKAVSADKIEKMVGDRLFVSGIVQSSLLQAQVYTSPVYTVKLSYKGDWSNVDWACKCQDNFAGGLHYDDAAAMIDGSYPSPSSPLDKDVQSRLIDLWHSFIVSGIPRYGSVEVPNMKITLPAYTLVDIGYDGIASVVNETDAGQMSFWNSLGLNEHMPLSKSRTYHTEL